jgi:hypothetical protein
MALGWPLAALFEAIVKDVEATCVDCGTCPVSIQCLASDGGNGWRYDCCGAVGIEVSEVLLIMDCEKNTFVQRERASDMKQCPLCSGDLVKGHVLGMSDHHRYLPTVHAKVPIKTRLALFHKTLPIAIELKQLVDRKGSKK